MSITPDQITQWGGVLAAVASLVANAYQARQRRAQSLSHASSVASLVASHAANVSAVVQEPSLIADSAVHRAEELGNAIDDLQAQHAAEAQRLDKARAEAD